jgi:hypothetical protein
MLPKKMPCKRQTDAGQKFIFEKEQLTGPTKLKTAQENATR